MKDFITIKKTKKNIEFSIDLNIYELDSIKKTCFVFTDNYHAFIKKRGKKTALVQMMLKENCKAKEIAGEFYDELLSNDLRKQVIKNNKNVREIILSRALYSAIDFGDKGKKKKKAKIDNDDPLGIMTPWEEKYEKK